jgi:hypothetical protein
MHATLDPARAVLPDKRAVVCNSAVPTSECSVGTLAFVLQSAGSWRIRLFFRSRSGRWITKWEDIRRFGNFRFKTIPDGHPAYYHLNIYPTDSTDDHILENFAPFGAGQDLVLRGDNSGRGGAR